MYPRYTVYCSGAPDASFRNHIVSAPRPQHSQYCVKISPGLYYGNNTLCFVEKIVENFGPLPVELYWECNTLYFVENFVEISMYVL